MKYLLITLQLCIGCSQNSDSNDKYYPQASEIPTRTISNRRLHELLDSALMGDAKAYNRISSYYFIKDEMEDLFYYAFTVANEYNNKEACYDVFSIIANNKGNSIFNKLDSMNIRSKYIAIYYLLKSYEMGFQSANYQVKEIFGNDTNIPNSSFYLKNLE